MGTTSPPDVAPVAIPILESGCLSHHEAIGCTMASLSAYENGTKLPPTQTIMNIAEHFKCSIDWLMGLKDEVNYDNSEISVKTYSDYIKKLFALHHPDLNMVKGCDCTSDTKDLSNTKGIAFYDPVIKLFLTNWAKTYALYLDNTIDENIYEAWKDKVLKDFNSNIIEYDNDWEDYYSAYGQFSNFHEVTEYDAVLSALSYVSSTSKASYFHDRNGWPLACPSPDC